MNIQGVGIDIVNVARFEKFEPGSADPFLSKVFFKSELTYCFSFKEPASHLAGIFACKEAASKALGVKQFPFAELEIIHDTEGKPIVLHKGEKIVIEVSITHTDTVAAAIAVR